MIVEFDKSFEKSLRHIYDPVILTRLEKIIIHIENSASLSQIANIKKLSGYTTYYRIRIGEYRVGFEILNKNTLRFIVIANRKDIYKIFP